MKRSLASGGRLLEEDEKTSKFNKAHKYLAIGY